MRGYETHIASGRTRTAVLIKKHHTTQQHQINHRIEHTLIELVPHKKTLQSIYILNVYSPPRDTLKDLDKFPREVKKVTKERQREDGAEPRERQTKRQINGGCSRGGCVGLLQGSETASREPVRLATQARMRIVWDAA
ncbi:hypothetical protein HPB49_020172 [Dermacentor silvarum]|uniref:Uncharacterized protein n=1 Tax=Dermacentor silvarum TaxID=543639 RepID=A0ACB8C577_DERSI|nr:hypothetical protein HPB49_020172 [Dermacentor silvarum]